MKRFFLVTAALLGLWVVISFVATMVVDLSHTDFWTRSLLWSILSVAVMAPVLAILNRSMSGSVASAPDAELPFVAPASLDVLSSEPEAAEPERSGWPYNSTVYAELMSER